MNYAAIASFVLSLIFCLYYRNAAISEKYKNEALNVQIQAMKLQSEAVEIRFKEAQKASLNLMQRYEQDSKKILNAQIDPGCEAAIAFGKEQAKHFDRRD